MVPNFILINELSQCAEYEALSNASQGKLLQSTIKDKINSSLLLNNKRKIKYIAAREFRKGVAH